MLKIRAFNKGIDEAVFVRIYNAAFSDYDDIRNMTLEEMKKTEEYPGFTTEGICIAEWDGETAGMVHAYVDKLREDQKGFIQSLAVLPQFRGKGIAKKLIEHAIGSLKQRGMKLADAWAQTDRKTCVHLFESFGFRQVRATSIMKRALSDAPWRTNETKDIGIRDMRLKEDDDVALANRLENEAFKEHFNFRPRTIEETKYALREIPWFQDISGFFALLGSEHVGYVITGIDRGLNKEKNKKYGWVLDIGVLKPHRRMQIGTSLMFRAMQRLKDQEMEEALLYVDDMNTTGAFELYKKLGFKVLRKSITYQLKIG